MIMSLAHAGGKVRPSPGRLPALPEKEEDLMARLNPVQFIQEVRKEVDKVTWPTRKEVWVTTLAVLVMVTVASIFFMIADLVLGSAVNFILGLGR